MKSEGSSKGDKFLGGLKRTSPKNAGDSSRQLPTSSTTVDNEATRGATASTPPTLGPRVA